MKERQGKGVNNVKWMVTNTIYVHTKEFLSSRHIWSEIICLVTLLEISASYLETNDIYDGITIKNYKGLQHM